MSLLKLGLLLDSTDTTSNKTSSVALFLLFVGLSTFLNTAAAAEFTFALVPKSVDNPFFDVARDGCVNEARILGDVKCIYVGPKMEDSDGALQASIVLDLLHKGKVNGLAISVKSEVAMAPVIEQAVRINRIPVVTFDSDAPLSLRVAYIGTNNTFFGQQLGKVVKQLRPNGGKFAIISQLAPNIVEREVGVRNELLAENDQHNNMWVEAEGSPSDIRANLTLAMEQMDYFAQQNVTAIIPVMGAPMRSGKWKEFVDEHRFRNIPLISGDAMPNQLEFLDRNYVHGLVGQLPYEMGTMSMRVLYDLVRGVPLQEEIYGTNVVSHIFIPLKLPELVVDHNLLGDLAAVGYILFALTAISSIACASWTVVNRKLRVIQLAQPNFLILIALGVLLMSCSLVPLSMDDGGNPMTLSDGTAICMSVPWLQAAGFTLTFSALYSKTRRVNKIFRTKTRFSRVKVTEKEVLKPLFFLLAANVIILLCWTMIDPMVYVRDNHDGTDGWNRVISTYGRCRSDEVAWYLVPLAIVNLGVLGMANWQAYEARSLQSEFVESKYIAMAMASLLQAFMSGMPILFIVREHPKAFYLTQAFMVFIMCFAILLLIFVPKIIAAINFSRQTNSERRRTISHSIKQSAALQMSAGMDSSMSPIIPNMATNTGSNLASPRRSSVGWAAPSQLESIQEFTEGYDDELTQNQVTALTA